MSDILSASQKKEWELANALKEFLPQWLEWRGVGGYPTLYRKGFLGSFKGVAFLTGDTKITIESSRWKDAILKALSEYKSAKGVTVDVRLNFRQKRSQ